VQLYAAVGKTVEATVHLTPAAELDKIGYVNQHGLSRKVGMMLSAQSVSFPRAVLYDACICSTFSIP
jgi:hypothetical protein